MSWPHHCQDPDCDIVALQDVSTGGKWVKATWDVSVLILIITCESTFISKF